MLGNSNPDPSASCHHVDSVVCWYSTTAETAQILRQSRFLLTTTAWEVIHILFPNNKLKMIPRLTSTGAPVTPPLQANGPIPVSWRPLRQLRRLGWEALSSLTGSTLSRWCRSSAKQVTSACFLYTASRLPPSRGWTPGDALLSSPVQVSRFYLQKTYKQIRVLRPAAVKKGERTRTLLEVPAARR